MRTILNFDDGMGGSPTPPPSVNTRVDAARGPVGLFQSVDATGEGAWGRWSGALMMATGAHVVALVVGLTVASRSPPVVKPPEPELVLMAYAPPPPPLGVGRRCGEPPWRR